MPSPPPSNSKCLQVLTFPAEPPPLPYSLHARQASIAIHWSGILLSSCFIPVVLYYSLHYGTDMSETVVFAITASAMGVFSIVDNARRTWLLLRPSDESRPLGTGRWSLDFFHISFLISFGPITALISLACASSPPRLDLLALPLPFLLSFVSVQLVVFTLLSTRTRLRNLCRVSSVPRGAPMRPPLYSIVEDVVAVNGGGGRSYREALDARYRASALFRDLLADMGLFWGVGGCVVGTALCVLVGTVDEKVSYGLCWTVPWAWAGIWAWVTVLRVKGQLRKERDEWATEAI